jgi:hypothetical protein
LGLLLSRSAPTPTDRFASLNNIVGLKKSRDAAAKNRRMHCLGIFCKSVQVNRGCPNRIPKHQHDSADDLFHHAGSPQSGLAMEFLQAFPVAIIDEDYDGKHAAGRGMRQLRPRRAAGRGFAVDMQVRTERAAIACGFRTSPKAFWSGRQAEAQK